MEITANETTNLGGDRVMIKATPISTMRSILSKDAKKGIEVTPTLAEAAREAIKSGKDVVVREGSEWFVLWPEHPVTERSPDYGKFEDVYIMLITGFASYGIPKGGLS